MGKSRKVIATMCLLVSCASGCAFNDAVERAADVADNAVTKMDDRIKSFEETVKVSIPGAMYQDLLLKAHGDGPEAESARKTAASIFNVSPEEFGAQWQLTVTMEAASEGFAGEEQVLLGQAMDNGSDAFREVVNRQELTLYQVSPSTFRAMNNVEERDWRAFRIREAIPRLIGNYEPGNGVEPGSMQGGLVRLSCAPF